MDDILMLASDHHTSISSMFLCASIRHSCFELTSLLHSQHSLLMVDIISYLDLNLVVFFKGRVISSYAKKCVSLVDKS